MMDPPYNGPKIESRQSDGSSVTIGPRELTLGETLGSAPAAEDPFVYGSRWIEVETPGGPKFKEVPLEWKDLFDPQEGDHVTHSQQHGDGISETKERLRCFFEAKGREDVLVCDDFKILWDDEELDKVGPDVVVIPGVKDLKRYRTSFDVEAEGTRPVFVLEVSSKATKKFDQQGKPAIYCRAAVQECFLLDQLTMPWTLVAYRLHSSRETYEKIEPDAEGRYLAETLGINFSIAPDGLDLILEDAVTGELLRKPTQEAAARRREVVARKAAERQAEEEAAMRRRETQARKAAERQVEEEAAERRREAAAREAAEARAQELLDEIERLRGPRQG